MTHRFKHSYIFRVSNTGCQHFSVFLTNFDSVGGEINCRRYPAQNGVKNRKYRPFLPSSPIYGWRFAWWLRNLTLNHGALFSFSYGVLISRIKNLWSKLVPGFWHFRKCRSRQKRKKHGQKYHYSIHHKVEMLDFDFSEDMSVDFAQFSDHSYLGFLTDCGVPLSHVINPVRDDRLWARIRMFPRRYTEVLFLSMKIHVYFYYTVASTPC